MTKYVIGARKKQLWGWLLVCYTGDAVRQINILNVKTGQHDCLCIEKCDGLPLMLSCFSSSCLSIQKPVRAVDLSWNPIPKQ